MKEPVSSFFHPYDVKQSFWSPYLPSPQIWLVFLNILPKNPWSLGLCRHSVWLQNILSLKWNTKRNTQNHLIDTEQISLLAVFLSCIGQKCAHITVQVSFSYFLWEGEFWPVSHFAPKLGKQFQGKVNYPSGQSSIDVFYKTLNFTLCLAVPSFLMHGCSGHL